MKRFFITIGAILVSLTTFSQGQMDALKYSTNELMGTARSVAMGGAFGALGGDISGIAINPAGIGIYKTSEIVTTMNFRNNNIETQLNNGAIDKGKFSFTFDNMAFVGTIPTFNDDVPLINFGFSYNRLKNFDQTYSMRGINQSNSLTDLIANSSYDINEQYLKNFNTDKPYEDWLSILGYQSFLINPNGTNTGGEQMYASVLPSGHEIDNVLHVKESGYINSYDFNAGTTIANMVSFGATVSVTDINYQIYSFYDESFDNNKNRGYSLENNLKTEGAGLQVKTGVIVKPVEELRIGIAYHSPTWYKMTNYFSASIDHDIRDFVPDAYKNDYNPEYIEYGVHTREYDFKTPDKWTFSLAGIIAKQAIVSIDYELTNYNKMSFDEPDGNGFANPYDGDQNAYIKEDFRNSSTLRIGAEYRITPQFSGRIGYSWQQSPIKATLKNGNETGHVPSMAGPISHYALPKDANYFTYGLGYRFSPQFYGDVAFVMKNQDSDLYAFGGADKATFKNSTFSGLLTFGYRF